MLKVYDFSIMSWRGVGVPALGFQRTGCGLGECGGLGLFLLFHILNILLLDDTVEDILILPIVHGQYLFISTLYYLILLKHRFVHVQLLNKLIYSYLVHYGLIYFELSLQ